MGVRNPALENAHRIIAKQVGISYCSTSGTGEDLVITALAQDVGMADRVLSEPRAVAREITLYLDSFSEDQ